MDISIIIPTYNEEKNIETLIKLIQQNAGANLIKEVIVVDGGSTDNTLFLAQKAGARIIKSTEKRRSKQLNSGAEKASGEIIYFLHADTLPPQNFTGDIINAIKRGADFGCYRLSFNYRHWMLKFICFLSDLGKNKIFKFGDHSLFITRDAFKELKGYREDILVMEDLDIIRRAAKKYRFALLDKRVLTSARKFVENGPVKLTLVFLLLYTLFWLDTSQTTMTNLYRNLIHGGKI